MALMHDPGFGRKEPQPSASAMIFNIERNALHDGPGIRTLVFFKGCPLRCLWCSNPEGQRLARDLLYDRGSCVGCHACAKSCPVRAIEVQGEKVKTDRMLCDSSLAASAQGDLPSDAGGDPRIGQGRACEGECVSICPVSARRLVGQSMTVPEVFSIIARDEVFYRHSGGGVTASGGEPLLHAQFLEGLFRCCHARGISTAVETCGYVSWEAFQQILPVTDFFLYDVKHMDSTKHREQTGAPNEQILENLKALSATGKEIVVRVPLIPGFNNTIQEVSAIASHVASLDGVREMHLLPFHRLGLSKYAKLEREYSGETWIPPEMSSVRALAGKVQTRRLPVKVEV